MNIFVLDRDITKAAQMHCDKHVVKMVLETAQLLSGVNTFYKVDKPNLYKQTHINHPCSKWVRESNNNYNWLYAFFLELCKEYTFRYSKVHLCESKFKGVLDNPPQDIPVGHLTERPFCMPDQYKVPGDIVQSYRNYYLGEKAYFAKWEKGREAPDWWKV